MLQNEKYGPGVKELTTNNYIKKRIGNQIFLYEHVPYAAITLKYAVRNHNYNVTITFIEAWHV